MGYQKSQCIGMRMRRLSRTIDNEYRKCTSEFGITENQLGILFLLSEQKKVSQGNIGRSLGLEKSTMSRNISRLLQNGVISKSPNYQPTIEITDKGLELVNQLLPKWKTLMDRLSDKLGESSLSDLSKWEQKLL